MGRILTATEHVYSVIKQLILSGELAPGEKIDQDALADRIGVSKMPVRTALEKLASQDFVVHHSHRGATVSPLSEEHLDDIYLVRCTLEGLAVKLATAVIRQEDIDILKNMIREQEELATLPNPDAERVLAANRQFHMYIYGLAKRPVLMTVIERLWDQSERYRRVFLNEPGMLEGSTNDHRHLVELMSRGEAEQASAFLEEHNRKTQKVVISYMKKHTAGD